LFKFKKFYSDYEETEIVKTCKGKVIILTPLTTFGTLSNKNIGVLDVKNGNPKLIFSFSSALSQQIRMA